MRLVLSGALAVLVTVACSRIGTTNQTAAGGRHTWSTAHVLRVGIQSGPNTLNPLLAANTTEVMIDRLMFDGLVSIDATGKKQVPVLAADVPTFENGGIAKDGLTITYRLRPNVRWHDGTPFTSADVAFSYHAIMNSNNNVVSRTGYELVRSVETPNATTVVFHMKRRFSPIVNTLFGESDSQYEVVPAHLLAKMHDINAVPFNAKPVGTGPFKLGEWVRGDHITLVANDRYFLGKPKLQSIVIRIVPDENTELNELRTHELDWQFEASPREYPELRRLTDMTVILQQTNQYERIEFNTSRPPFDDVRVRRAVALAIDKRKLVDNLTFGSALVADQDLPPFMWAHARSITRYAPNRDAARALLTQAGWLPGPGGVRVKNGRRLSLSFAFNASNTTRRQAVVAVQAMLAAVGIEVEIKGYDGALLFAPVGQGGILQNGKYDLAWTGWVAGIDPDDSSVVTCAARPPNGNNSMFYCDPSLDAAEREALDRFDVPSRTNAYARIEAILTRDVPMLPIWWPRQLQPISTDFQHFSPNPVTESWNAYTWDI